LRRGIGSQAISCRINSFQIMLQAARMEVNLHDTR
jgi:hypothetical protein